MVATTHVQLLQWIHDKQQQQLITGAVHGKGRHQPPLLTTAAGIFVFNEPFLFLQKLFKG